MEEPIRERIRYDIGGDHQRISSVQTSYADITFKHILLPVWVTAYRYNDKAFRIVINARTGEVQGERPYSVVKIVFLVLMIILLICCVNSLLVLLVMLLALFCVALLRLMSLCVWRKLFLSMRRFIFSVSAW